MLNKIIKEMVGGRFGEYPVDEMDTILFEKKKYTLLAIAKLPLNRHDIVLDFGGGLGWSGHTIAPLVHQYIYADINQRYLDSARAELCNQSNVDFYKVDPGNLEEIKKLNINKIFSLSVFTQFNLYEAIIHLQEIYDLLDSGGMLYFDYMNYNHLDIRVDRNFKRHIEFYRKEHNDAKLVKWHDPIFLEKSLAKIGFKKVSHDQTAMVSSIVVLKE